MRFLLMAALLAAGTGQGAVAEEEGYSERPALPRSLAGLELGDSLKEIQLIYPPAAEWPFHVDPRGRVTRYFIAREQAKKFPVWTESLRLGLRRGKLVDIQIIYDAQRSREKTYEELARDLTLTYGEAGRSNGKFWWVDKRTVLRVFPVEVPALVNGRQGGEWRASIQILEKRLYKNID